jgi:hypothetical protein
MIDAWKNKGHKQVCKDIGIEAGERSAVLTINDSQKATIDAVVARQGYTTMANLKGLGIYKDQIYRCLNCNEAPS